MCLEGGYRVLSYSSNQPTFAPSQEPGTDMDIDVSAGACLFCHSANASAAEQRMLVLCSSILCAILPLRQSPKALQTRLLC